MVFDNKIAVLILQHPQEQDRVLGTAKLICSTLAHAKLGHTQQQITVDRRANPKSEQTRAAKLALNATQRFVVC